MRGVVFSICVAYGEYVSVLGESKGGDPSVVSSEFTVSLGSTWRDMGVLT